VLWLGLLSVQIKLQKCICVQTWL